MEGSIAGRRVASLGGDERWHRVQRRHSAASVGISNYRDVKLPGLKWRTMSSTAAAQIESITAARLIVAGVQPSSTTGVGGHGGLV